MNAATRAVIERLVEALEQYAPRDRAITQDLIAEASKLLEGDALAQPADEDAWLVEAKRLTEECIRLAVLAATSARPVVAALALAEAEKALTAHLRTRPQQAGFVSVPVEPTDAMRKAFRMHDFKRQTENEFFAAMIAAATKGDGK